MRILIDILHPAHVHFFRNFHHEMRARGHEILISARRKEIATELLDAYALPYTPISTQRSGALGLAIEMVWRSLRLIRLARSFRADVLTGIMGPSIAVTGRVLGVPAVVFYDTEFATQSNRFVYPLAHSVCTPDCYQGEVLGRHVTYAGYHELAYLHPRRFQPDPARLASFGVRSDEPYSVVRFVSWEAVHDRRERGLTADEKRKLVSLLEHYGRVLISSEGRLPDDLDDRRITGPIEDIHHLLAHACLVVGESATMSSEAAVLGVPAIYIATTGRGYTDDQEKRYGLVRHFTEERIEAALDAIRGAFEDERLPETMARARAELLNEKVDVTAWMVAYFEREFGTVAED